MQKWMLLWWENRKLDRLLGQLNELKLCLELQTVLLLFGMPLKENQFVLIIFKLDVLQSFDNEITRLEYIEDR